MLWLEVVGRPTGTVSRFLAAYSHLCRQYGTHSGQNDKPIPEVVPFKSLSLTELGPSILLRKGIGSSQPTQLDLTRRTIIFAKCCSFGSSTFGLVMIPTLTGYFLELAADSTGIICFLTLTNSFLGLLTFTPFLLHFLVKRFVLDLHYNPESKIFTSVHYNLFLRRRALRFRPADIVDPAKSGVKLLFPLATCFVHGRPLLLNLDEREYTDKRAFALLTDNLELWEEGEPWKRKNKAKNVDDEE